MRRVVTLIMAACLLVSCSTTENPTRGSGPDRTASISPTPSGGSASGVPPRAARAHRPVGELPTVPATDSAATFARQLDRAAATLRTRDPSSNRRTHRGGVPAGRGQPPGRRPRRVPPTGDGPPGSPRRPRHPQRCQGRHVAALAGRAPGAAAALADRRTAPRDRAARLLQAGATTQRRAVDLPGRHPPGRDAHGPDPRHQYGRGARADAVPPVDLGPVRRRRRHQRPARRDPRRRPSPEAPRRARRHGRRAVALQPRPTATWVPCWSTPARCSDRPLPTAATGTGACSTATPAEPTCCPSATRRSGRCCWPARSGWPGAPCLRRGWGRGPCRRRWTGTARSGPRLASCG